MLLYLEHFAEVRVKLSASAGPRPIYTPHAANQTGPTRQLARRGPGHRGPPHHQRSVTSSQLMRNNLGNPPAEISVMRIQDRVDEYEWTCLALISHQFYFSAVVVVVVAGTAQNHRTTAAVAPAAAVANCWWCCLAGLLRFLAPLSPSLSAPLLDMPNKDIFNLINKTKTSGPQL